MQRLVTWFKQHSMGVAVSFVVLTVLAGLILNMILFLKSFETYEPLTYFNPRIVSNHRVAQGTFVDVQFRWCNDDPDALISSNSVFQQDAPVGVVVPRIVDIIELPVGCHVEVVRVNLPETVTPGHWILGGSDRAVATDGRSQSLLWYTDSFEVVAPNGTQ